MFLGDFVRPLLALLQSRVLSLLSLVFCFSAFNDVRGICFTFTVAISIITTVLFLLFRFFRYFLFNLNVYSDNFKSR